MYPILLKIGEFELRSYGVMIALAFLLAALLGGKEAKRRGSDPNIIYDFLFYAMISGLLGARIYYVLFSEPAYFFSNPAEIFAIWKGGIAIQGGILGGLVAGIVFCRNRDVEFWSFADLLAPSIILGQGIGRGACTLNGCSFGKPTDLPWAITFTDPNAMAPLNISLHPTQLYELFGDLLIFAIIWSARDKISFKGGLFLIYVMMYGVLRFTIESFRDDSLIMGGLRAAQVTSAVTFVLALVLFLKRRANPMLRLKSC